jgi:UDP-3-O-[3-hydroxymyristoyl] glucosamine N-acyltransferase
MKLSALAERTGARVEGAGDDVEIVGAAGLDEASEGQVTFLANPRYTPRVNSTHASAIYLSEDAQTDRQIAILRVKDPYLAYTRALRIFNPEAEIEPFIHPSCEARRYRRVFGDWPERVHR